MSSTERTWVRAVLAPAAAAVLAACELDSGWADDGAVHPPENGAASVPARQAVARIPAAAAAAAQAVEGEDIRRVVAELGDDRCMGWLPGTEGDALARRFLADALERLGFEPVGRGYE